MRRAGCGLAAIGCLVLPVVTLVLGLKMASDRNLHPRRRYPTGSTISLPPRGSIRILARNLTSRPARVAWEWTIIGDRNWRDVTADPSGFTLAGSSSLNSPAIAGSTHIWTLSLTESLITSAASPRARVETSLRGSNASSASRVYSIALRSADVREGAKVLEDRDITATLPAAVHLADIAGQPLGLTVKP